MLITAAVGEDIPAELRDIATFHDVRAVHVTEEGEQRRISVIDETIPRDSVPEQTEAQAEEQAADEGEQP